MVENNYRSLPCMLVVLVGLPASGKTTIANLLQQYFQQQKMLQNNISIKIIDIDKIRIENVGLKFDPLKEEAIIQKKYALIKDSIAPNTIILIDDMHYYVSMRHEIYQIAKKTHSMYFTIAVETPLENCLSWNINRGESIPNSVITSVAGKFDPMGLKYRWDKPDSTLNPTHREIKTIIGQVGQHILERWSESPSFDEDLTKLNQNTTSDSKELNDTVQQWDQMSRKMISLLLIDPQNSPIIIDVMNLIFDRTSVRKKEMMGPILADMRKKFLHWLKEDHIRGKDIENLISMLHSFHEFLKHQN